MKYHRCPVNDHGIYHSWFGMIADLPRMAVIRIVNRKNWK